MTCDLLVMLQDLLFPSSLPNQSEASVGVDLFCQYVQPISYLPSPQFFQILGGSISYPDC